MKIEYCLLCQKPTLGNQIWIANCHHSFREISILMMIFQISRKFDILPYARTLRTAPVSNITIISKFVVYFTFMSFILYFGCSHTTYIEKVVIYFENFLLRDTIVGATFTIQQYSITKLSASSIFNFDTQKSFIAICFTSLKKQPIQFL